MADAVAKRSGWITFAGVMAVLAGGYNALSGIAALSDDDTLAAQASEVLYGIDLTAWGWFWLIVGVVQTITGMLIFLRNVWDPGSAYFAGLSHADCHRHFRLSTVSACGPHDRLPCLFGLLTQSDEFLS